MKNLIRIIDQSNPSCKIEHLFGARSINFIVGDNGSYRVNCTQDGETWLVVDEANSRQIREDLGLIDIDGETWVNPSNILRVEKSKYSQMAYVYFASSSVVTKATCAEVFEKLNSETRVA